jgi:diketogulonate reductase-like aldo/keto reductase
MNCEAAVEPSASWHESWNALERAYAEGHVSSIGVSNFNHQTLSQFNTFGTMLPHVVQNAAQPGNVDMSVREWCSDHHAVYVPHSSQVNFNNQPQTIVDVVKQAAVIHAVSPNAIISKFFVQSGEKSGEHLICVVFLFVHAWVISCLCPRCALLACCVVYL